MNRSIVAWVRALWHVMASIKASSGKSRHPPRHSMTHTRARHSMAHTRAGHGMPLTSVYYLRASPTIVVILVTQNTHLFI
jgi:hypothetical protein